MRFRGSLLLLVGLSWLAAGCSVAVADEIFICERNRVVRALPETLEVLKRTDPCVAAHFGLIVPPKPVAARRGQGAGASQFSREVFIDGDHLGEAGGGLLTEERLARLNPDEIAEQAREAGAAQKADKAEPGQGNWQGNALPAQNAAASSEDSAPAAASGLPRIKILNVTSAATAGADL